MKHHHIITRGLLDAIGAGVYITIVALFFQNANDLLGKVQGLWAPIFFLLLFVTSAAITGGLVLGKPILLYLDNKKHEGVELFLWTVVFLVITALIVLLVMLLNVPAVTL